MKVVGDIPDAKLYIIGDGPMKDELQSEIRHLGLIRNVRFLGWLEEKEVASWLGKCKAFIFASTKEFFPNVLMEAIACGTPVITIKKPSYIWILNDAALYADPYSPDDFAEKIVRLLKDELLWRELSEKATKRTLYLNRSVDVSLKNFKKLLIPKNVFKKI